MKIAICDDEQFIRESIKSIIEKIDGKNEFFLYKSADELLNDNFLDFDIIFLDIGLPETDGINAAKRIRTKQLKENMSILRSRPLIVFITGLYGHIKEAFDIHAFGYIEKPINGHELLCICQEALRELDLSKSLRENKMLIKTGGETVNIKTDNIIYIESSGRKNIIHLKNESVEYYGSISELESRLIFGFFRIHKGYLINLKYIEKYDRTQVIMAGGASLLISKYRYRDFVTAYMNFLR